jgi:hypothetical protein
MRPLEIVAMTFTATRRLTQIGFLLAVLGSASVALGGIGRLLAGSRSSVRGPSPVASWGAIVVGALVVALGLGLVLIALHFGITPYKPRIVKPPSSS